MKKVSILWMSALLLMLAGCSGDETGDASDLVGYWKVIDQEKSEGKDPNTMGGLCFKENGEIIAWGKGSENWYERYTGKWWVSDEGELLYIPELRDFQRPVLSFAIGVVLLVRHVKKAMMWNI